jgi:DNA-binding CsgD family transcriptional regulator
LIFSTVLFFYAPIYFNSSIASGMTIALLIYICNMNEFNVIILKRWKMSKLDSLITVQSVCVAEIN